MDYRRLLLHEACMYLGCTAVVAASQSSDLAWDSHITNKGNVATNAR